MRRYNFNHERWALTIQASRFARVCLEESFKYALKRKTFGKTLMEHPVIRAKIGEMARQVECTHAQLENITYQMCTLSKKDAMEKVRRQSAERAWRALLSLTSFLSPCSLAARPRC